jgi:iron complex outermembrane receptor protein
MSHTLVLVTISFLLFGGKTEEVQAQVLPDSVVVLGALEIQDSLTVSLGPIWKFSAQDIGFRGGASVGAMLGAGSLVHLMQAGDTGSVTLSLRGAGSARTSVFLDGMRLVNPATGVFDLSLIPGFLIQDVEVVHGSNENDPTALGGSIHLSTGGIEQENRSISLSGGQWGRRSVASQYETSMRRTRVRAAAQFEAYSGDYVYQNTVLLDRPKLRRTGADKRSGSAYVHVSRPMKKGDVSLLMLASTVERGVPGLSNAAPVEARQEDHFFRIQAKQSRSIRAGSMNWQVAANSSDLVFEHPVSGVSQLKVHAIDGEMNVLKAVGQWVSSTQIGVERSRAIGLSDDRRLLAHQTISRISKTLDVRVGATGSLRRTSNQDRERSTAALRPHVSVSFSPPLKRKVQFFWKIAGIYRDPTLNELFWIPGGNPLLRSESGLTTDLTASFALRLRSVVHQARATMYHHVLREQIVWRPQFIATGLQVWTPENMGAVVGQGIELSHSLSANKMRARLSMSWMRSQDRTDPSSRSFGKQLRYHPQRLLRGSINRNLGQILKGTWDVRVSLTHTGPQFVTSDETRTLPGWTRATFSMEAGFRLPRIHIDGWFALDNALDSVYETTRFQPMPGRHIRMGISIHDRLTN